MHSINYLYTLVGTADFVCGLLFMRSFGSLVPVIFDTNNSRGYERLNRSCSFMLEIWLILVLLIEVTQVTAKMFSPNFNFHVPM